MKCLITGNLGYVGPIVVAHLRNEHPDATLIGFDSGFFGGGHSCRDNDISVPDTQVVGDVREFPVHLLEGVDALVHLAAISNDPMGSRFEGATEEINFRATIDLAQSACRAGVKNFVFASSCGVYGSATGAPRRETDELQPLTAYARSKVDVERHLRLLVGREMTVTCLRFATACGMSPGLRLDLVLNDFVASALASGKITVVSDGTPWRPLIDVRDMARAIEWAAIRAPENGAPFLAVNVGRDDQNYRMKELADAVANCNPGTTVAVNDEAAPDRRSYRVDFSLFRELAPEYVPRVALADSVASVRDGLKAIGFADTDFRSSSRVRLRALERHVAAGRLTADLRWTSAVQ